MGNFGVAYIGVVLVFLVGTFFQGLNGANLDKVGNGVNVFSASYKGAGLGNKFVDPLGSVIVLGDDVEEVLQRMRNVSMRVSSNITEILAVQEEELRLNEDYRGNWTKAVEDFHAYKKDEIFKDAPIDSIIRRVPEEYHIAVLAYTGPIYRQFVIDTQDISNEADIENYRWKSFFKLLELAIQILGREVDEWADNFRFLYRGATIDYTLEEGQLLAFQRFASTSVTLPIAEDYAGNALFEIQGYYNNGTSMVVWDHSYFQYEKEILFRPIQVFRVESIHPGRYYTRYVLVKPDIE